VRRARAAGNTIRPVAEQLGRRVRAMHEPKSEKAKMLAGDLYRAADPELVADQVRAQRILVAYNATGPDDSALRTALLGDLLGAVDAGVVIRPPFFCDYGYNIRPGKNLFVNYDCVFLDCAPIDIGDDVQIGPAVQLYTATHPLDAEVRRSGLELAKPIRIGSNVWIGGAAVILPGVTIGDDAVIGAGSVVTRDVPKGVTVVGNPARRR
jgi:maltose O-acetyltransferase